MDNVGANVDRVNEELSHSDAMIKKGKQKIADLSQESSIVSNEVSAYFKSFSVVLIINFDIYNVFIYIFIYRMARKLRRNLIERSN